MTSLGMKRIGSAAVILLMLVSLFSPGLVKAGVTQEYGSTSMPNKIRQANGSGPVIDSNIDLASDKKISVIVELKTEPVAVQLAVNGKDDKKPSTAAAGKTVKQAISDFKTSLKKSGIEARVTSSFENVLCGVVLEINARDISKFAAIDGIKAISESSRIEGIKAEKKDTEGIKQSAESDNSSVIGADEFWRKGYEGQGIKIGILSTGIDYNHPDLKDAYKGGYDFVDDDNDPYEGSEEVPTYSGTHTAGVLVGNGDPENGGVRGIAPKASLYVYRIMGPDGGSDVDAIRAIDKAVADGIDVLNLSFNCMDSRPDIPIIRAVNNAIQAGVTCVSQAGDLGGFGYGTVDAPGTSTLGITVGGTASGFKQIYYTAKTDATGDREFNLRILNDTQPRNLQSFFDGKEIVYVGLATTSRNELIGRDLTNKVVLAKFGGIGANYISGYSEAVKELGASGIIFFHKDGANEYISDQWLMAGSFPFFDMRGDDGRYLVNELKKREVLPGAKGGYKLRLTGKYEEVTPGDEYVDDSAKGPAYYTMEIKPDIVVPSIYIRSAVPAFATNTSYLDAYFAFSGTGIGTPLAAGMAALVKQARPDFTPYDIKAALMNTGKEVDYGWGKSTVLMIGSGCIQGLNVLNTPVLAQVPAVTKYTREPLGEELSEEVSYLTGSVNFGELYITGTSQRKIVLKDIANKDTKYNISYELRYYDKYSFNPNPVEGINITLDKTSVTVPSGGSAEVNAAIDIPMEQMDGIYDGYIYFTPEDDTYPTIKVPFAAYKNAGLSDPVDWPSVSPKFLSLNGDGVDDSTVITYEVLDDEISEGSIIIQQKSIDWSTPVYSGIIRVLQGDELKKGVHSFVWDGTFIDSVTGEKRTVETSTHALSLQGKDKLGNDIYKGITFVVANEDTEVAVDQADENNVINITENKISGTFSKGMAEAITGWWYADMDLANAYHMNCKVIVDDKIIAETIVAPTIEMGEDWIEIPRFYLEDVFPAGRSTMVLTTYDKTGNEKEFRYEVNYDRATTAQVIGKEAKLGSELKLTLQGNQVSNLIGAQFKLNYRSDIFTFSKAEIVKEYASKVPGSVINITLSDPWTDENGNENRTAVISVSQKGNLKADGFTGDAPVANVYFKVSRDVSALGSYPFTITEAEFTNKDMVKEIVTGSSSDIEVYADYVVAYDYMTLEAFTDTNGNRRSDVVYNNSPQVSVKESDTGIEIWREDEGYRGLFYTLTMNDGTFMIFGLNPGKKYDIEITYEGHFSGILKDVQAVTIEKDGTLVPAAEFRLNFGTLLAGDTNSDNIIDQRDVDCITMYLGQKSEYGSFPEWSAKYADINGDGIVDETDLGFALKNYGKWNRVKYNNKKPEMVLNEGKGSAGANNGTGTDIKYPGNSGNKWNVVDPNKRPPIIIDPKIIEIQ